MEHQDTKLTSMRPRLKELNDNPYLILISMLIKKGLDYVGAYKLLIELIQDSLVRFEQDNVVIKKSICYFLFEKIISRLSTHSEYRITESETSLLKTTLLNGNL